MKMALRFVPIVLLLGLLLGCDRDADSQDRGNRGPAISPDGPKSFTYWTRNESDVDGEHANQEFVFRSDGGSAEIQRVAIVANGDAGIDPAERRREISLDEFTSLWTRFHELGDTDAYENESTSTFLNLNDHYGVEFESWKRVSYSIPKDVADPNLAAWIKDVRECIARAFRE